MRQNIDSVNSRRVGIINMLKEHEYLPVSALSKFLSTSEITIRRDLNFLQSEGILTRFHGGAKLSDRFQNGDSYFSDSNVNNAVKTNIAKQCDKLIKDGEAVFIGSGSTTYEILRLLSKRNITIITNHALINTIPSPCIATIIGTGGIYNQISRSYHGEIALHTVNEITADLCIIGVNCIDIGKCLTMHSYSEAYINKAFLKQTRGKRIMVADHSKFVNSCSSYVSCDFSEIDIFITDDLSPKIALEMIRAKEVEIVLVEN